MCNWHLNPFFAGALFDAQVASELFVRLGKVAEEHLSDDARAAKAYTSAAEQTGDSTEILAALDRLYGRLGDTKNLAGGAQAQSRALR